MMSNIEAVAWGEKTEKGCFLYTIQATFKGKREKNTLTKEAMGWKHAGEGYNPHTDRLIMLLKRSFEDRKSWRTFAKTLSFPIEELNCKTGKKRIINARRRKRSN